MNCPFYDAPNTAAIVCCHVLNQESPVLYVSHDEDGTWQFLCGGVHQTEEAKLVSLMQVFQLDHTVGKLKDMPNGCCAERASANDNWILTGGKTMGKETAAQEDLLEVLDLLDSTGIRYWLDGGWGVDVLIGRQTREHRDIDINFDSLHTEELLGILKEYGYEIVTDWSPVRVELYHPRLSYIDIHPFVLNDDDTAKQADLEGGWYEFEADFFGQAVFGGRTVPCISAKGQKVFHTGYELREVDRHDIANIDELLQGDV